MLLRMKNKWSPMLPRIGCHIVFSGGVQHKDLALWLYITASRKWLNISGGWICWKTDGDTRGFSSKRIQKMLFRSVKQDYSLCSKPLISLCPDPELQPQTRLSQMPHSFPLLSQKSDFLNNRWFTAVPGSEELPWVSAFVAWAAWPILTCPF